MNENFKGTKIRNGVFSSYYKIGYVIIKQRERREK